MDPRVWLSYRTRAGMTQDHLIERIRRLCGRLIEAAPWWRGWWAPIEERRLSAFERAHGVSLPGGHRRLLSEIGDRAPIPGRPRGGLLALEHAIAGTTVDLGPLAHPFFPPLDEPDDETPLAGCLPILDGGCDTIYLLVVTGSERGRVWSFTPSGAPQLRPTGSEFLDWYVDELERGVAPLEIDAKSRDTLARRVAEHPEDREASVALGRRLLLLDRSRARALLESAWGASGPLDPTTRIELRRAVAELDLLEGRRDRIEAMADDDDDWLRTYAGIAAARADDHERAIERLEGRVIPVPLRSAAIGHLACAHAARGRIEHAIELLRGTQASASNHAIAAKLRGLIGERETARRSWQEALAAQDRSRSGPRPPRLADFIEVPVPSPAAIEAAIRALQA